MKRIFIGLAVIGIVVVATVQVTRAYWSDTAVSSGNTFSAGVLNLVLSDDDEIELDDVNITWNGSGMKPGEVPVSATLTLKNAGNINASHVHISVTNTPADALSGPGVDDTNPMDLSLQITALSYDGSSILSYITDTNENGYADLDDWENIAEGSIGPSAGAGKLSLADFGDHTLAMTVQLNINTPDDNQGDSVATDVSVIMQQVDGQ